VVAHFDLAKLPAKGRNNVWYRYSSSDTTIVFVHGVLSDSRSCWLHTSEVVGSYWPEMIEDDPNFDDVGIFLGGYYTSVDAGRSEIRNAADELLAGLRRGGDTAVLNRNRIIFVCHSTGGIVVRYILTTNDHLFVDKAIGLVLIASPSSGSRWANRLSWLTSLYGHQVGKQLAAGHWTLRELDAQFKNLVNERRIQKLVGVEAYENHFVIHRKWLPDKLVVVTEESAGRYFGAPILLPQTDHFSTVKPNSRSHPAYELLRDFYQTRFIEHREGIASDATNPPTVVFERRHEYPTLKFSIVNNSDKKLQVCSINALKVAFGIDKHDGIERITGPRTKLALNLTRVAHKKLFNLLGDRITKIEAGDSEAYQLDVALENLVCLIDFEIEYIAGDSTGPTIIRPDYLVIVHSATPDDPGQFSVLKRQTLFEGLISGKQLKPWSDVGYESCEAHRFLLVRGAATLASVDPLGCWEKLKDKFAGSEYFSFVLASYADGLEQQGITPEIIKTYLAEWISRPNNIRQSALTDYETPAITVSRALLKSGFLAGINQYDSSFITSEGEMRLFDRLLFVRELDDGPDDDEVTPQSLLQKTMKDTSLNLTKGDLLARASKGHGRHAVEFLIASIVVQPELSHEIHDLLCGVLNQKRKLIQYGGDGIADDWWSWWQGNRVTQFIITPWRVCCPRLTRAFEAYQAKEASEFLNDTDDVVRYAASRREGLSTNDLSILAEDDCPMIRLRVAKHPRASPRLLRKLAEDKNSIVRRWVSANPNVEFDVVMALTEDPIRGVREFAQAKFKRRS
jgi:hypothetical protein